MDYYDFTSTFMFVDELSLLIYKKKIGKYEKT